MKWGVFGLWLVITALVMPLGYAEPSVNVEALADAIRGAEGNSNYGILKPIKGRNYRLACIQTIRHAQRDYKTGDFIAFLASRYAPIGAENDPKNLNANWEHNVRRLYAEKTKGEKSKNGKKVW